MSQHLKENSRYKGKNSLMLTAQDEPLPLYFVQGDSKDSYFFKPSEEIYESISANPKEQQKTPKKMTSDQALMVKKEDQSLFDEMKELNRVINNMHVLEKIMISQSNDPIFDYEIGFQSEEQVQLQVQRQVSDGQLQLVYQQQSQEGSDFKDETSRIRSNRYKNKSKFAIKKLISFQNQWNTINETDKLTFLQLRKQAQTIKKALQEKSSTDKDNHQCILCGAKFENGRQLGGHMSRRHPGNSIEHVIRKRACVTKKLQRKRRDYFRSKRNQVIRAQDTDEKK